VNMAPIEMPVLRGRIGNADLAEKMFNAWIQGTNATVDIGGDWDFWSYLELPLDIARERMGISAAS
jgi:hypothetical protein